MRDMEDFCFCNSDISLQIVSGGAAPEGLYGRVTLKVGEDYVDYIRSDVAKNQLAAAQAENLRLRDALVSLLSWVDDWAETGDTDFPRIEGMCNQAISSQPGGMSALREVIAKAFEEFDDIQAKNNVDFNDYVSKLRSGEWTPEALK